jgi:hypothetical protein
VAAEIEALRVRAVAVQADVGVHDGLHRYSLEEFGLTTTGVRRHFRDYCDRFDIPLK